MNTDSILNLINKIQLPDTAAEKVMSMLLSDESKIEKSVKKASLDNIKPIKNAYRFNREKNAVFSLAASLIIANRIHEKYLEKGIPDYIYYDTMGDISVWVKTAEREKNVCGLLELSWIRHSIFMNMFKIGRLQYQFYKTDYFRSGLYDKDIKSAVIPNQSSVLNIHIPEGGRLDINECKASLLDSRNFFAEYYPNYDYKGFVCDSWILDPKNGEFMAKNSNIFKFKDIFDCVVPTRFSNSEIQRRIWGTQTSDKNKMLGFCEDTDLQHRTKQYLLSGGKTGNGYGFILK